MTKLKIISLLLLLSISTLYPLTNADWYMINALRAGSTITGAATGGFIGYKTGTFLGGRVVPATAKKMGIYMGEQFYGAPRGATAEQREAREIPKRQFKRRFKRGLQKEFEASPFSPWMLTPTGIIAGGEFGYSAGERLAAAYIARKYGVSRAEAWNAIENNLDLSEKLKK